MICFKPICTAIIICILFLSSTGLKANEIACGDRNEMAGTDLGSSHPLFTLLMHTLNRADSYITEYYYEQTVNQYFLKGDRS